MLWRASLYAMMLSAAGVPLYIHLPRYASAELGIGLGTLGGLLLALRAVDFLQDPALGRLIDRFPNLKPLWSALGCGGMALGFLMLFGIEPPIAPIAWLVLSLLVLLSAFSLSTILFYGHSIAIAGGRAGLPRLSAFREAGGLIGVIIAAALPSVLVQIAPGVDPYLIFALFMAVLAFGAALSARPFWGQNAPVANTLSLSAFLKSSARPLLALALLNALPVALTSTLFQFFVVDLLRLPDLAGPFLTLFFLSAALTVPIWAWAMRKIHPRPALLLGMIMAICAFFGAVSLGPGDTVMFALICMGSGAALAADMVILPALFAARLDADGLEPGAAFGLWGAAAKLALALAAATALPLLGISGFQTGGPNTANALLMLTGLYAGIPCILKLGAIFYLMQRPKHEVML